MFSLPPKTIIQCRGSKINELEILGKDRLLLPQLRVVNLFALQIWMVMEIWISCLPQKLMVGMARSRGTKMMAMVTLVKR